MTPPCSRCHGAPYTPALPEGWDRPSATSPHCGAESRWSGESNMSAPDREVLESWVRTNFERAQEAPRPFRIDIGEAHVRADIRLQPRVQTFWAGNLVPIDVNTNGARASADLELYDNAFILGGRELLNIQNLGLDGPASVNAWPQSIRIGNFGQLHVITQTTPTVLFPMEPFMVPRPPIGEDLPTERQWEACEARNANGGIDAGLETCAVPMVYPNHREDPRLDLILTRLISREFLESDGRLPTNYNLETLFANFMTYRRNHPPRPAAPEERHIDEILNPQEPPPRQPGILDRVQEWLIAGSHVDLDIEQLRDFFIPGVLDLGPSRGQVRLTYRGGQRFGVVADNFEIQLDPSGYPFRPNGERSPVEIQTLVLSSAHEPYTLDGGEIPPGIRLDFNAATGELWAEANVSLQSDLTVPVWGPIEFSGSLALRTALRVQQGRLHPIPETTHAELRDVEIWEAAGRRPILTQARIDISDTHDPFAIDRFDVLPEDFQGMRVQTEGYWGRSGSFHADLSLPLDVSPRGHYDFSTVLQELPARLALNFYGRETYQATVNVLTPPAEEGERRILADVNLQRGTGESRRTVIQDGQVQINLRRPSDLEDGVDLRFNATRFAAFGLSLQQPSIHLDLSRFRHENGITEVRIPNFQIAANPRGSNAGLLRGPFRLELQPSRSGGIFTAIWNETDRLLDFRNLDLRFSLQGINLAPLHSAMFRRLVDHRVATLGLDGHFQGFLNAHLPLDRRGWRASGSIDLRGDRDGDVYFLDSAGHRVGPALVRDTRWHFERVNRINWQRHYALGNFRLDTLLNFSSFLPHFESSETTTPAYGLHGQRLRPFEINGVMPYNNQPWDLRGFRNRIVDYLTTLCQRDAQCQEELR